MCPSFLPKKSRKSRFVWWWRLKSPFFFWFEEISWLFFGTTSFQTFEKEKPTYVDDVFAKQVLKVSRWRLWYHFFLEFMLETWRFCSSSCWHPNRRFHSSTKNHRETRRYDWLSFQRTAKTHRNKKPAYFSNRVGKNSWAVFKTVVGCFYKKTFDTLLYGDYKPLDVYSKDFLSTKQYNKECHFPQGFEHCSTVCLAQGIVGCTPTNIPLLEIPIQAGIYGL